MAPVQRSPSYEALPASSTPADAHAGGAAGGARTGGRASVASNHLILVAALALSLVLVFLYGHGHASPPGRVAFTEEGCPRPDHASHHARASDRELVVISMHRSGSSFLTGLLFLCGANVGDPQRLLWEECPARVEEKNSSAPPVALEHAVPGYSKSTSPLCGNFNANGYYEEAYGVGANIRLLESLAEFKRGNITAEERDAAVSNFKRDAEEVLGSIRAFTRNGDEGVVAIKDPRLSLTFKYWRPLFTAPVVVYSIRDPVKVAKSMNERDLIPTLGGLAQWERHVVGAMNQIFTSDVPAIFIDIAELQHDIPKGMRCIVDTLRAGGVQGLSVPPKINDFYNPDQKHGWFVEESPGIPSQTPPAPAPDPALLSPFQSFLFKTVKTMSLDLESCDPQRNWDEAARAVPGGRAFWANLRVSEHAEAIMAQDEYQWYARP